MATFYFKAVEAGTISIVQTGTTTKSHSFSYSTNAGTTWTTYTIGSSISLLKNQKIYWKGTNPNGTGCSPKNYLTFTFSNQVQVYGNIMEIVDDGAGTTTSLADTYFFYRLFYNATTLTDASALELPATTLKWYAYYSMFQGCTSLTTAPELPATVCPSSCYRSMFQGCTALITPPSVLNITTIGSNACQAMFYGCTALTSTPTLPSITEDGCYYQMFYGCTSLTTTPALPATTLYSSCYYQMFYGCTSLTTASEMSFTTTAKSCCNSMFYGCNHLVNIQSVLYPTTANNYCYQNMFYGCTALEKPPALPATTLQANCYSSMFYGCTSLKYVPSLSATTIYSNCYYQMFYGCTSLYVSSTSTSSASQEWKIPYNGTYANAITQTNMFTNCAGTRTSQNLVPVINSQSTYYTQNTPITTVSATIYDYEGGTIIATQVYMSGASLVLPTPTRSGYLLTGWKDSEGNTVKSGDTITSNMTIYGQWAQIPTTGIGIIYNSTVFTPNVILDADYVEYLTLIGDELNSDTLNITVRDTDNNLSSTYKYGNPLDFYNDGILRSRYYVIKVKRTASNTYTLSCVSAIGLLYNMMDYGGFYQSRYVGTVNNVPGVLDDIMSGTNITYTIDANVASNVISQTYLPIASKADNIHQILLTTGASIMKNTDGSLHFLFNEPEEAISIPAERLYDGGSKEEPEMPSKITVIEHQYYIGTSTDTTELYDTGNETVSNVMVKFSQPYHTITPSTGLTINSSNANYAIVSGAGTLTGIPYIHSTVERVWENPTTQAEANELTIGSDVALITGLNSENVLQRMIEYYTKASTVSYGIKVDSEKCGNLVSFTDPFGTLTTGYIHTMDNALSNIIKSQTEIITDWVPNHLGNTYNNYYLDKENMSGNWTVPDGVSQVKVVLIGGGTGGNSGHSGTAGGRGTAGAGGAWGDIGSSGGKIHTTILSVSAGDTISWVRGDGGTGNVGDNVVGNAGEPSTITYNGTTYTSNSGVSREGGVINVLTGEVFATAGTEHGMAGGSPGQTITTFSNTYYSGSYGADVDGGGGGQGGGPAVGYNGSDGGDAYYEWWSSEEPSVAHGGAGGAGATPEGNTDRTAIFGGGGVSGHGGGGGGYGGWASYGLIQYGDGGAGGIGGRGGKGGKGIVLIYY